MAIWLGPAPSADAVGLAPGAPETYTVRPGDTLWSIAAKFLRDPWRWREVWQTNAERGNPNLIYPGEVLRLTTVNGQPRSARDHMGERVIGYRGGCGWSN